MRWEQLFNADPKTGAEEANARAARYRAGRSWIGLIHGQRMRRIECEVEKCGAQIAEYWEAGDGFHVDRLLEELMDWRARDPFDESQWIVRA